VLVADGHAHRGAGRAKAVDEDVGRGAAERSGGIREHPADRFPESKNGGRTDPGGQAGQQRHAEAAGKSGEGHGGDQRDADHGPDQEAFERAGMRDRVGQSGGFEHGAGR